MTNSPKQCVLPFARVLTLGMGFVLFAIVCFSLSQRVFAETVPVNGMNDSTNYTDVDIVDTLGKAAYTHSGKITGTSSLTVNAPETNSYYRQWLGGSNGSYTFTGPITVNGGQLLINSGKLSTKTINLNGGDMYVMYEDCLPHDAVVNIGEGSMLDVEVANNAVIGATFNVSSGGTFRQAERNVNDSSNPITLNIAGTGTSANRGAIHVRGGGSDLNLTANINLTNNAELFLTNMNTGKQLLVRGTLTGSSTLTLASDDAGRWIRLYEGTNTATSINAMDLSEFSGNFVVDKVKARFYTSSLGTGSNITVQNSATAYFNNTNALNNYNGSFTVNNATISLEAAGKLNNLSGNGSVSYGANALMLNNTEDTTFSGVISGSGAVSKTGDKTLTLTAANTYTGKTTVSGGTLKLSGASAKLASTEIDVAAGTTLLYDNTFPHNTSALTINVTGGTLEFYNTTVSTTHTNNGICSGVAGQDVTINGTDSTFLIDGGGTVSAIDGTGKSTITFALDSNSVFHVKNGYFINGGYATQNWDNNKAELRIGATGKVECWDGAKMQFGGLSGDEGAQLVNIKAGKGMVIGNGVTANQSYTYNGSISLNGKNIDFVGAGTQTLNGAISNVSLTSKAGTLVLGTANNNNNISIGSSSIIKADGGAVRVDGNVVVSSGYLSAFGTWTGDGSIKVNSGGVLRINNGFKYDTGITLNGGILFNDGDNNSSAKVTFVSPITVSAASSVQCGWSSNKSGEIHLGGGLHGSASLTVNKDSNMGWIYFEGEGDYTGTLILKGKIVTGVSGKGTETAPASTTPYLGSGEIQLDGGLLLNNSSYWDVPNTINVVSNSSIRAGYSRPFTFSGQITGSGTLTIENDNSWIVMKTSSPDNSFTGDVLVNYSKSDSLGRLQLAADQPFGANVGQCKVLGTLDMNGFSQKFKGLSGDGTTGNINNNTAGKPLSTLILDTTGKNSTYKGKINGNIALEIIGTGTQTFANNGSNFTGNVVINGGTVTATAAHSSYTTTALGAFSKNGGRTVTINSGAELVLGTNDVLGGCNISNFNDNSLRYIINGGKLTGANNNPLYNATFQNGAEVYGNNNRDIYRSFWLMGTNNVTFAGDGSTPESPVNFNGTSGVIFVLDGTVLNVEDITLSDESDLVVNVSFGNKSESPITTNSLTKTGAGTVELTAANEYTAGTTISEGVLKFTDAAVVANGPITVEANGTLEYNLSSGQTKKLTITNASKIFSTGKVVKTGDGTLQIYTAAAGQVDASSFVVSSGRLDMKEYFKGSLDVEANATMSPGNSVGKLTVDGTYNLDSGAALLLEVGKDDLGNIVIDQLFVNGNATFAPGSIIDIVLDPSSSLVGGDEFSSVIITANNAESIFDDVQAAIRSYYFTDLTVTRSGNEISLSGRLDPNAVPEPSTWALLVLGVIALAYMRKRVRS